MLTTHLGTSGGYDIKPQEEADRETLFKILTDTLNGSANKSLVLPRSIHGGTDDCKFMYSLLPGIPMIAFAYANMSLDCTKKAACGNSDQEQVAEIFNNAKSFKGKINFASEGDYMINNWHRLARAVSLPDQKHLMVATGDNPFSYNHFWMMDDSDLDLCDLLVHLNGKENIPQLFDRNYYDTILRIDEDGEQPINFKEPNKYSVTNKGLDVAENVGMELYHNRRAGGLAVAAISLYAKYGLKHPEAWGTQLKVAGYFARKSNHPLAKALKLLANANGKPVTFEEANKFANSMINTATSDYKVHIKSNHTDPFAVRDIDAVHDFVWYRAILEEVTNGGQNLENLEGIYPHWDLLKETREGMRRIPFVASFDEHYFDKLHRLNEKRENLRDIYKIELEEFYQTKWSKRKTRKEFYTAVDEVMNNPIPHPFTSSGRINTEILGSPQDVQRDIKKTVDYMKKTYHKQFNEDKAKFYQKLHTGA